VALALGALRIVFGGPATVTPATTGVWVTTADPRALAVGTPGVPVGIFTVPRANRADERDFLVVAVGVNPVVSRDQLGIFSFGDTDAGGLGLHVPKVAGRIAVVNR
jgi:hypothetical protein